jgi:hypothetical protein
MEKTNIDALFIVLVFVATLIGAYVLLIGNWGTPIPEWLIMGWDEISINSKTLSRTN